MLLSVRVSVTATEWRWKRSNLRLAALTLALDPESFVFPAARVSCGIVITSPTLQCFFSYLAGQMEAQRGILSHVEV